MTLRNPLSVGAVARILHISKPCVLNWINSGALKAFTTYGGHHRVWPADVKALVDRTGMDIQFDFIDERAQRVLIVDDDTVYANFVKQILKQEMPQVDVATTDDGYEALLMIGEFRPQLMILDIKMPKVDGFRVLELLKTRNFDRNLRVLVASGYLDKETRDRLAHTIADMVIEKPSNVHFLISTIADLLTTNTMELHERSSPAEHPRDASMSISRQPRSSNEGIKDVISSPRKKRRESPLQVSGTAS